MEPMILTDAELWSQSLRGNGESFAGLFDRHRDRVFRSVLRIAQTREQAEDIVAVTFLELWRLRERVRLVDDSVLPWLLVTAFNVARNSSRAERRYRRFLAALPIADHATDASELALDRIEGLQAERRAIASLRALPRAEAEILALVGVDELSLREAARVLGITDEAAKKRMTRARRRAREALAITPATEVEGTTP